MSSITITLSSICAGGGHGLLQITGDISKSKRIDILELLAKAQELDDETIIAAVIRIAKIGRTNNQVKTLLQNSLTVTI